MDDEKKAIFQKDIDDCLSKLKASAIRRLEMSNGANLEKKPNASKPLPWELPEGSSGEKH